MVGTPRVNVEREREAPRGWSFRVRVDGASGETSHDVHLSWVDHEYWSHGQSPPSEVVAALVELLAERGGLDARLGASFDASAARRLHPWLDEALRERL